MPDEIKIVLECVFLVCVTYLILKTEDDLPFRAIAAVVGTIMFLLAVAFRAPKPAAVTTRIDDAKAAYETYKMRRDLRKIADEITDGK